MVSVNCRTVASRPATTACSESTSSARERARKRSSERVCDLGGWARSCPTGPTGVPPARDAPLDVASAEPFALTPTLAGAVRPVGRPASSRGLRERASGRGLNVRMSSSSSLSSLASAWSSSPESTLGWCDKRRGDSKARDGARGDGCCSCWRRCLSRRPNCECAARQNCVNAGLRSGSICAHGNDVEPVRNADPQFKHFVMSTINTFSSAAASWRIATVAMSTLLLQPLIATNGRQVALQ